MKKTISASFALLCAAALAATPSGSYLSWLGNNAGADASGNQSEFIGALSGQNAQNVYRSSFLGIMSGYNASGVRNTFAWGAASLSGASDIGESVFIGPYAGANAHGVYGRTFINGQLYIDRAGDEFYIAPDSARPSWLAPLWYSAGTLRENVDFKIATTEANRTAFENAVADVWLSAYDGSDANDGLSPTSAVRTIGRAYAVAYDGITNGTFNVSNEVVVAVAEGRYDPVALWASITNGVHYMAVGDKADTVIYGSTNSVPMAAVNENEYTEAGERRVTMSGFTVTGFRGSFRSTDNPGIVRGIKFVGCDFTGNDSGHYQCWLLGDFVDCNFWGNRVWNARDNTACGGVFGMWTGGGATVSHMTRCHVWGNRFDVCDRLLYNMRANGCLFENEFCESYGVNLCANNTVIAERVDNPRVTGKSASEYKAPFRGGSNGFAVIASPGNYPGEVYVTNSSWVVVSHANLTADRVAADADCPSVRSDGKPDYGYRDSGLGWVKLDLATALAGKASAQDATITSGDIVPLTVESGCEDHDFHDWEYETSIRFKTRVSDEYDASGRVVYLQSTNGVGRFAFEVNGVTVFVPNAQDATLATQQDVQNATPADYAAVSAAALSAVQNEDEELRLYKSGRPGMLGAGYGATYSTTGVKHGNPSLGEAGEYTLTFPEKSGEFAVASDVTALADRIAVLEGRAYIEIDGEDIYLVDPNEEED